MIRNLPTTDSRRVSRILNRLVQLHARSLAVYLTEARPEDSELHAQEMQVIHSIASDHLETADRLAEELLEREQKVERGTFPLRFTSLHDLSIQFLTRLLLGEQERIVAELEQIVQELEDDGAAQRLALEALGAAKAHGDMLRELQSRR